MSGWSLGIDFGTSCTAAAVADGQGSRTIDIESSGRERVPSATFLSADGEILVGSAAQEQSALAPERYEPTPRRAFGETRIFLGDRLVDVAELAGAVLRRVYAEACRRRGESTPAELRVTHPAHWAQTRRDVLIEACARGGLPTPELIPEAVAAAVQIALEVTSRDRHIAVFDYGGGTFEAAVLLRTASGFEIAGPPVGRDPLGGEDIDERILGYIGGVLAAEFAEQWQALLEPTDADSRRATAALRVEVQRAKETLSEQAACQLRIPGITRDVQLTRQELEELIRDDVGATVDGLAIALKDAGVEAKDLAGLHLVGGSSPIPLVSDMLWTRFGVEPMVHDRPKSVVATGAAGWTLAARQTATAAAAAPSAAPAGASTAQAPAPAPAAVTAAAPSAAATRPRAAADGPRFQARLAMAPRRGGGSESDVCVGALVIERPGARPATLQVTDEPARGSDTAALAAAALSARTERTPGFHEESSVPAPVAGCEDGIERRFSLVRDGRQVAMLEQYAIVDGRAIVITGPEDARPLAESITLGEPPPADGSIFHLRFELPVPAGWWVTERLSLTSSASSHPVAAERVLRPADAAAAWRQHALDELMHKPSARLALRSAVRLFDTVAGEVATVTWHDGRNAMVTKLGLATTDDEAFSLRITLPHADQQLFAQLTERAFLYEPAVVATGG